jgi:hemerythrin-like domain-containing protein
VIRGSIAVGTSVIFGCAREARSASDERPGAASASGEISATEDLMREHGLLNRVLLIYEEAARRLEGQLELRPDVLPAAAALVRTFVEGYHEKLEEEFVFPRFEQALSHVDLVRTLRDQHQVGRKITAAIEQMTAPGPVVKKDDRKKLVTYLRGFVRMYRPHEAREDTALFPDFHKHLTVEEANAMGEAFEQRERTLFGENGFDGKVNEIDQLEIALDMHELSMFTAPEPK